MADVGTDHAMIPVWLAQTGRATRILATDIRPGPMQNAAALVAETDTGDKIRLMLTDGLTGVAPEDGEVVIIAGMGGETMVSILAVAPWTRESRCLILEPQSKKDHLRRFLVENGYQITQEHLVKDAGRIYPILCVQGGISPPYEEAELHLGLLSQIGQDPLFGAYLDLMRAQTAKAAPYDPQAMALLGEFDKIKERFILCHP